MRASHSGFMNDDNRPSQCRIMAFRGNRFSRTAFSNKTRTFARGFPVRVTKRLFEKSPSVVIGLFVDIYVVVVVLTRSRLCLVSTDEYVYTLDHDTTDTTALSVARVSRGRLESESGWQGCPLVINRVYYYLLSYVGIEISVVVDVLRMANTAAAMVVIGCSP